MPPIMWAIIIAGAVIVPLIARAARALEYGAPQPKPPPYIHRSANEQTVGAINRTRDARRPSNAVPPPLPTQRSTAAHHPWRTTGRQQPWRVHTSARNMRPRPAVAGS